MKIVWRLAVLFVLAFSTGVRARTQLSFEEIVARVSAVAPTLQTFIVDQVIDLRLLGIFRWRLRATVYAERPGRYRVVVQDPPAILRRLGVVFADATSPERLLADYRAVSVRQDGAAQIVAEVEGHTGAANPARMRVTVDTERWVVTSTLLRYVWGDVQADYKYGDVGGYHLPVKIRAVVPGFAVRADIAFVDYRLNVSLPEGHQ